MTKIWSTLFVLIWIYLIYLGLQAIAMKPYYHF